MPTRPEIPSRLGRYQIIRPLGAGGMGTVYLAEDTLLGRTVALKVPHFCADGGPEAVNRFLREARVAAGIGHPNLCPVHDVGTDDGVHYLVMPYVEGTPLSRLVSANLPWPPRQAAELVGKLAQALQALHGRGLMHRDLKPGNILIRADREPVLLDFGLARSFTDAGGRLTRTGEMLGSPAYMAPEQVLGQSEQMGPATDVYGLGMIFYELLTGRLPFAGTLEEVFEQVLNAEPLWPSAVLPELDKQLDALCRKALAKKAEERYPSMAAFASALAAFVRQEPDRAAALVQPLAATRLTKVLRTPTAAKLQLACPRCGKDLKVTATETRTKLRCPSCQASLIAGPARAPSDSGPLAVSPKEETAAGSLPETKPGVGLLPQTSRGGGKALPGAGRSEAAAEGGSRFHWLYLAGGGAVLLLGVGMGLLLSGGKERTSDVSPSASTAAAGKDLDRPPAKDVQARPGEEEAAKQRRWAEEGRRLFHGQEGTKDFAAAAGLFRRAAEKGDPEAQFYLGYQHATGLGVKADQGEAVRWYREAVERGQPLAMWALGRAYCRGRGVLKDEAEGKRWLTRSREGVERLARQGDIVGANALGVMYAEGLGVEKDDTQAAEWYRKAATQGLAAAQYSLGNAYAAGLGVEKDDKQAAEWYRKAAAQGYAQAQTNLGFLYENGRGVEKDDKQAAEWYRKAATQGEAVAQYNLGNSYAAGRGVEKDDKQAAEWYRKAAVQEIAGAQYNLGNAYANGRGVEKDDKQAVEWYRKAAAQEYAQAQASLGFHYGHSLGVEKDDKQAFEWYRKAAAQGLAAAQYSLGLAYAAGRGVEKDDKQAVEWYRRAAVQGLAQAQTNLGFLYENGRGVEKDDKQAAEWYRKAATQDHPVAQYNLGNAYAAGRGVEKDDKQAVEWYRKAAAQGYAQAQTNLGFFYESGRGVQQDDKQAIRWYTEAANAGEAKAIERLRSLGIDMRGKGSKNP